MIFGIETSTVQGSLSLIEKGEVIQEIKMTGSLRHAETIFGVAETMLRKYERGKHKLRGIGVSIGPGMFTALRVGLALAKGLGLTRDLPVVGVNTLDALAQSVSTSCPFLMPLISAGRGEVYMALYENT